MGQITPVIGAPLVRPRRGPPAHSLLIWMRRGGPGTLCGHCRITTHPTTTTEVTRHPGTTICLPESIYCRCFNEPLRHDDSKGPGLEGGFERGVTAIVLAMGSSQRDW